MSYSFSQSGLPVGDPAGRGVSLDPEIPGYSSYSKPSQESPRDPVIEDLSIYHIDDANSLLKNQTLPDEIDHSKAIPTMRRPGPHYDPNKTKYPYRNNIPDRHNASVDNVVQLWFLKNACEITLSGFDRIAIRLSDIENGLNPKVVTRSNKCSVSLKRADVSNLRWIFSVDSGNGPKMVRLKATRKKNVVALAKMDVTFSCSCEAWRWWGSEYHAKGDNYLDGKPRGTASPPTIRDPNRHNRVCKHVAAVIDKIRNWTIPK